MTGIELFQIAKYNTAADNARIFAKLPALTKWVEQIYYRIKLLVYG